MKILHATSELYPLIKTGGLADALGALPFAQQKLGHDVRVILPYYAQVQTLLPDAAEIARCNTFAGDITLRLANYRGIGLYLIDAPGLYHRSSNPYHDEHYTDYSDNVIRFGLLGWAAAAVATGLDSAWGAADILHAHDWQAGLAPAYLHHWQAGIKSVFTIHNIAYQGLFQSKHLPELYLPWSMYQLEGLEFHDQLSFLKAGIFYADQVTTVSPTYAQEITQEPAACGLGGLLRIRQTEGRLNGILNGVDNEIWNPKTDIYLDKKYHLKAMQGKSVNKAAIQAHFGLPANDSVPLLVMISRLTQQKGIDLLLKTLCDRLVKKTKPFQFILLGSGSPDIEQAFVKLAETYPKHVAVHIGYNEMLAHRVLAAADVILLPSRFEPCGLTQLYGMKYGALPLVRQTGGLADTVRHTDETSLKDKTATGFVFADADAESLSAAINQALALWAKPRLWSSVRKQAMLQDFSWQTTAERYIQCYRQPAG